mmetsp:Transcript_10361/g.34158  ORF Transcript_10361/g.34158 Transcript_10361/m.34158 type:complete len:102 (+) Transcript_10361:1211-1516(+)
MAPLTSRGPPRPLRARAASSPSLDAPPPAGDFEILAFSVQPNDQNSEFNFRRTSSVSLRVFGVDASALEDITRRLRALVDVLESAEGSLTVLPPKAAAPPA